MNRKQRRDLRKDKNLVKELYSIIIKYFPKLLDMLKPDYIHILKDKNIIKTGDASLSNVIETTGFTNL